MGKSSSLVINILILIVALDPVATATCEPYSSIPEFDYQVTFAS